MQSGGCCAQRVFDRAFKMNATRNQALTGHTDLATWIVVHERLRQSDQSSVSFAHCPRKYRLDAEGTIVEPLAEPVEHCGHAQLGTLGMQTLKTLAGVEQLEADRTLQPLTELKDALGDLVLGLGNEFRGSRRCRGSEVG